MPKSISPHACSKEVEEESASREEFLREIHVVIDRFERFAFEVQLPPLERELYLRVFVEPLRQPSRGTKQAKITSTRTGSASTSTTSSTSVSHVSSPHAGTKSVHSTFAVSPPVLPPAIGARPPSGRNLSVRRDDAEPSDTKELSQMMTVSTALPPRPPTTAGTSSSSSGGCEGTTSPLSPTARGNTTWQISMADDWKCIADRLQRFKILVGALEGHRAKTVALLKFCCEREQIIENSVFPTIRRYKAREMTTLELQGKLLTALYDHQRVSLGIVEGVRGWREGLSRPFPFMYKGRNCLVSILDDCARIESEGLSSALPLLLNQFPLSSNMVESLALFGEDAQCGSSLAPSLLLSSPSKSVVAARPFLPPVRSPRRSASVKKWSSPDETASPRKKREFSTTFKIDADVHVDGEPAFSTPRGQRSRGGQKKSSRSRGGVSDGGRPDGVSQSRLIAAESVLKREADVQLRLAEEVRDLAISQHFLPILRVVVENSTPIATVVSKSKGSSWQQGQIVIDDLATSECNLRNGVSVSVLGDTAGGRWLEVLQSSTGSSLREAQRNVSHLKNVGFA